MQNAYFPLFIPERLLTKEQEHLAGFTPEVAWVTHVGETKLDERLAIRPTSEAIMYDSYAKWIRSWRDLPLKINQWNNVVRWEFKHAVPFLRTREFLWNEGHTVHASKEEAEAEVLAIIDMYETILNDYMALYAVKGRKSKAETFAGAEYTLSLELLMPNGKAIQGPDAHFDGQKFAKAFNISFLDKEEKKQYAWQNTFAITTRMIGVMVAQHSDDKGLVLPPKLAEHKAVIIPIVFKEDKKDLAKANELAEELHDLNPIVDDRDGYRPGFKFAEWELKGIPLRIEIGPKDLENKQAVVVRRDTGEKQFVALKDVKKTAGKLLNGIHANLYSRSKQLFDESVLDVQTMQEFEQAINDNKIARVLWCDDHKDEAAIKDKTGAKVLNMPFAEQDNISGRCVLTGKPAKAVALFGRSY